MRPVVLVSVSPKYTFIVNKMSKTYITTANAGGQYSPATRSNDMLLFAGSADQRVIIGVGANAGQPNALVPNYFSVGSNDTIIGHNLI
jgi:hypothetical protein